MTKDALDHEGAAAFVAYPTYSMAILWNMNYEDVTVRARYGLPASLPVDGDALARSAARQHKNDEAWARLHEEAVELLRVNHYDIGRGNR